MIKIFFRMFLGLLATAISAFYTYKSGLYITIATGMSYGILAIIEIAVVFIFSLLFRKLSPTLVTILFYTYSFINGVTLSTLSSGVFPVWRTRTEERFTTEFKVRVQPPLLPPPGSIPDNSRLRAPRQSRRLQRRSVAVLLFLHRSGRRVHIPPARNTVRQPG